MIRSLPVLAAFALACATPALADPPDQHPAHPDVTHKTVDVHRNVTVHRNVVVNRRVITHPVVTRPIVENPAVEGRPVVEHPVVEGHPIVPDPVRPVGAPRWRSGVRYEGERRVFNDWGRYHLRQPPAGYQWVQDGNEVVLINLGTGIIGDTFIIPIP